MKRVVNRNVKAQADKLVVNSIVLLTTVFILTVLLLHHGSYTHDYIWQLRQIEVNKYLQQMAVGGFLFLSGYCLVIVWRLSGDFTPALKTWSLPTNCDHKASALQFRFWWQEKTTHQHDCSWYAPSCVSLEQQCESSKDSRTVSLLCEFSHVVTFYVCPSLPLWFHIRDICVSHCVGQDRCESRSIPRIPASSDNEGSLLPPCYPLLDHSYLYGKQKV